MQGADECGFKKGACELQPIWEVPGDVKAAALHFQGSKPMRQNAGVYLAPQIMSMTNNVVCT
jgi:hypothetical protein